MNISSQASLEINKNGITNTLFTGCESTENGGAIYIDSSSANNKITLDNIDFNNNKAIHGTKFFIKSSDLSSLLSVSTLPMIDSSNEDKEYMGREDDDTLFVDLMYVLSRSSLDDVYILKDSKVIEKYCGYEGYPCYSLDYAYQIVQDSCSIIVLNDTESTSSLSNQTTQIEFDKSVTIEPIDEEIPVILNVRSISPLPIYKGLLLISNYSTSLTLNYIHFILDNSDIVTISVIYMSSGTLRMNNCEITRGTVEEGKELIISAIQMNGGDLYLINCSFNSLVANATDEYVNGAALYVSLSNYTSSAEQHLVIEGGSFNNCKVSSNNGKGGAIYVDLRGDNIKLTLSNISFNNNSGRKGKNIYMYSNSLGRFITSENTPIISLDNGDNEFVGKNMNSQYQELDLKYVLARKSLEDIYYKAESGSDTNYCGSEGYPCSLLQTAFNIVEDNHSIIVLNNSYSSDSISPLHNQIYVYYSITLRMKNESEEVRFPVNPIGSYSSLFVIKRSSSTFNLNRVVFHYNITTSLSLSVIDVQTGIVNMNYCKITRENVSEENQLLLSSLIISGGSLIITECTFSGLVSKCNGAAISGNLEDFGSLTIKGKTVFENCKGINKYGGAIFVTHSEGSMIIGDGENPVIFKSCSASSGGAIYINTTGTSSTLHLSKSIVFGSGNDVNSATIGRDIYVMMIMKINPEIAYSSFECSDNVNTKDYQLYYSLSPQSNGSIYDLIHQGGIRRGDEYFYSIYDAYHNGDNNNNTLTIVSSLEAETNSTTFTSEITIEKKDGVSGELRVIPLSEIKSLFIIQSNIIINSLTFSIEGLSSYLIKVEGQGSITLRSCNFKGKITHNQPLIIPSSLIYLSEGKADITKGLYSDITLNNGEGSCIYSSVKVTSIIIKGVSFNNCKVVMGNGGVVYINKGNGLIVSIGGDTEEDKVSFTSCGCSVNNNLYQSNNENSNTEDNYEDGYNRGGAVFLDLKDKEGVSIKNVVFTTNEANYGTDYYIIVSPLSDVVDILGFYLTSNTPVNNAVGSSSSNYEDYPLLYFKQTPSISDTIFVAYKQFIYDGYCGSVDYPCNSIVSAYNKLSNNNNTIIIKGYMLLEAESLSVKEEYSTIIKPETEEIEGSELTQISFYYEPRVAGESEKSLFDFSEGNDNSVLSVERLIFIILNNTSITKSLFTVSKGILTLTQCSFIREPTISEYSSSTSTSSLFNNDPISIPFSLIEMSGKSLTLTNCNINSIHLTNKPSINISSGSILIDSSSFSSITRDEGDGSALSSILPSGSSLNIISSNFTSCIVNKGNGGALYLEVNEESSLNITGRDNINTTFSSCSANNNNNGRGGAIYIKIIKKPTLLYVGYITFGTEEGNKNNADGEKGGNDMFVEADDLSSIMNNDNFPVLKDMPDGYDGAMGKDIDDDNVKDITNIVKEGNKDKGLSTGIIIMIVILVILFVVIIIVIIIIVIVMTKKKRSSSSDKDKEMMESNEEDDDDNNKDIGNGESDTPVKV